MALEDLSGRIKDANRGERGYIITGDPAFLAPFHAAAGALPGDLARVGRLTADNPRQQRHVRGLRALSGAALAEMGSVVGLRRTRGFEAARAEVARGTINALMDAADAAIRAMEHEEHTLLRVRSARAGRGAARAMVFVGATSGLGITLLLGAALLIFHDVRERRRAERALREPRAVPPPRRDHRQRRRRPLARPPRDGVQPRRRADLGGVARGGPRPPARRPLRRAARLRHLHARAGARAPRRGHEGVRRPAHLAPRRAARAPLERRPPARRRRPGRRGHRRGARDHGAQADGGGAPPRRAPRRPHRAPQPVPLRRPPRPPHPPPRREKDRLRPSSSSTSTTSSASTTRSATPPATSCSSRSPRALERPLRAGDTVARLGGDEFAVLLEDVGGRRGDAATSPNASSTRSSEPFVVDGQEIVAARASASRWPSPATTTRTTLLRDADIAMYRAKAARPGALRGVRARDARRPASSGWSSRPSCGAAIEREEFVLHYQPIVVVADRPDRSASRRSSAGSTRSAAWSRRPIHPDRRGDRADRPARAAGCSTRPAARSRDVAAGARPPASRAHVERQHLGVSSPSPDSSATSRAASSRRRASPLLARLEITESVIMDDTDGRRGGSAAQATSACGSRSTTSAPATRRSAPGLPVDLLKIDRSSSTSRRPEGDEPPLVRAILALAAPGHGVVAEGIETAAQLAGCASSAARTGRASGSPARSRRRRPRRSSAAPRRGCGWRRAGGRSGYAVDGGR